MPSPTIREVAKEANVSIATVSYVLNDSRPVTPETRERVLNAARRLGYRPNIIARNLQASETRLFGYTWRPSPPDSFNPILDRFLQAMAEAAARHGYRILTFPTASLEEELAVYQELVRIGQVDGFILSNTNLNDQRVRALLDLNFPFVAFGRSNPDWDFLWVDVDGTAGTEMATLHLIERGHRRIACLAWPEQSLTGQYRLQGYLRGMAQGGLEVLPEWISYGENLYNDAYHMTWRLLSLPQTIRPTGIIAMSDLMAMGALNAAWDAGYQAGRDLAVVGFDDAPVAQFFRPALSSVRQPIAEVGERLATMLADLVCKRPIAAQHVLLRPELIVRASSAQCYAD
ncbi:MAG: LacI family DNA-binding transcriptional regulator [Anaerolineae bacterium]